MKYEIKELYATPNGLKGLLRMIPESHVEQSELIATYLEQHGFDPKTVDKQTLFKASEVFDLTDPRQVKDFYEYIIGTMGFKEQEPNE